MERDRDPERERDREREREPERDRDRDRDRDLEREARPSAPSTWSVACAAPGTPGLEGLSEPELLDADEPGLESSLSMVRMAGTKQESISLTSNGSTFKRMWKVYFSAIYCNDVLLFNNFSMRLE